MTDLDALLAGIVADPHNALRWLIVADWLDDHGQPERAELLRLHRELIRTCCEPDAHPERAEWQARVVELIDQGVKPCVPQHTLMLPGGVLLVGNFIPPGSFLMGSEDGEDDEKPVHKVTIKKGFFVGIHPVTQAQWQAVKGINPSNFQGEARPVESVTWQQALEFCAHVSAIHAADGVRVQLLTEALWEYACRAGTTTKYHFGDHPDERRMCVDGYENWYFGEIGEHREETIEVCQLPSNPWGLLDCHGNVTEYCLDRYEVSSYVRPHDWDPLSENANTGCYVLRGGSWDLKSDDCRSASRDWCWPATRNSSVGFRVAFTLC